MPQRNVRRARTYRFQCPLQETRRYDLHNAPAKCPQGPGSAEWEIRVEVGKIQIWGVKGV